MKSLLNIIPALLVAGFLWTDASATGGGEPNNTGCNGKGNPNSPCEPTDNPGGPGGPGNGGGGNGGSGGAGGHGGDAVVTVDASTSSSAAADASASANSASSSNSSSVALGGVGAADASASGGAASASNGNQSTSVSISHNQPDDVTIRNVPSIDAPSVFPTVSCFKGTSFSLGVPGAGGSFGGGKIDEECTKREEIRLAGQLGFADRALYRWCGLPNNIEEFGSREACLGYEIVEPVTVEVTVLPEPVAQNLFTAEQCDERSDRQFEACVSK